MGVDEHTIELAGSPVFLRRASSGRGEVLYLHSLPTSSEDWLPFLERAGGVAPDLLGFGRSGKGGHLDFSLAGQVSFVLSLLDALALPRLDLVGHGWGGAVALALAALAPERVRRLVLVDPVPPAEAFRWPWMARLLRQPVVGELVIGAVNRAVLARVLRSGAATPAAWPQDRVDAVWRAFDQGTQRAILRILRTFTAPATAAAAPESTLVVWGERDPWLPAQAGEELALRLGGVPLERVPDAGHWPWLDQPAVVERVAGFLAGGP